MALHLLNASEWTVSLWPRRSFSKAPEPRSQMWTRLSSPGRQCKAPFRTSHSFQITVVKPTFSAVWLVPKCHHNTHGLLTTENKLLFPMSKVHNFVKIVSNLCHLLVLEITSNLCCFGMYKWYQLTNSSVGPLVLVIFWGEEGLTLDRNSNGSI